LKGTSEGRFKRLHQAAAFPLGDVEIMASDRLLNGGKGGSRPTIILLVEMMQQHRQWLSERYTIVDMTPAMIAPDVAACAAAQVVWTNGGIGLSETAIQHLPRLEIVVCQGVGYENIDLNAARARKIAVVNGRGTNSATVADHAMALLLSLLRQVSTYDRQVRSGKWDEVRVLRPILTGRRVGILGLGNVGRLIAQRAKAFDCEIHYHSRHRLQDCPYHYAPTPLDLARACDVLMLSCPGGRETHHAVNAEVLDALGPDGYLVNVARGSVVDTAALMVALTQRRIAGAALDVVEGEPDIPTALYDVPNLVLVPHVGGLSPDALDRAVRQGMANLDAHFSSQPLLTPII
jgi:lactate dehydrogenase-like 2-hydroxyacid dehydrogenase